eukprot:6202749-Pleurochrysis_carterae.AAC.1
MAVPIWTISLRAVGHARLLLPSLPTLCMPRRAVTLCVDAATVTRARFQPHSHGVEAGAKANMLRRRRERNLLAAMAMAAIGGRSQLRTRLTNAQRSVTG